MKVPVIIAVIVISLSTAACSYMIDFVVVNDSEQEIEVKCETPASSPHRSDLGIVDEITWKKNPAQEDWRPLADTSYSFDAKNKAMTVKVPPKSAVRLLRAHDGIFFGDGYKNFELKKLSISGSYGDVSYEGEQVLRNFSERTYTVRFFVYNAYKLR